MIIFWNKKQLNKYIDKRLIKTINKVSNSNEKDNSDDNLQYPKIIQIKGFKSNSPSEQFEQDME